MRKALVFLLIYLFFFALLVLTGCSTSLVKPVYIDPEDDLSRKIEKTREAFRQNPTLEGASDLLENSLLYYDRMNYKVRENNKRAVG